MKTVTLTEEEANVIVNIIDIVAERSGFKGPELFTVGTIREKIAAKLNETIVEDTSE